MLPIYKSKNISQLTTEAYKHNALSIYTQNTDCIPSRHTYFEYIAVTQREEVLEFFSSLLNLDLFFSCWIL